MRQSTDETRLNRPALVKCQFGVADTHPRPFRQLKHRNVKYTGRLTLLSHISTSLAIQKTLSETVYCLLLNICVAFRRSSREFVAQRRRTAVSAEDCLRTSTGIARICS